MAKDKELPRQPVVGDLIKLKPERMRAYREASALAGYVFDEYAIRTVIRTDPFGLGGGRRLVVEGAPHMFAAADVNLAWVDDKQRAAMLLSKGWTKDEKSGRWSAP
jgi:hypothetical protein